MAKCGYTIQDIACAMECSHAAISNILRTNGVTALRPMQHSPSDTKNIYIAEYRSGRSVSEIASYHNVKENTVRAALRGIGIKMRKGRKNVAFPHPWVVFPMYQRIKSIRAIAEELGCSRGPVRDMLNSGGIDTAAMAPTVDSARDASVVYLYTERYYKQSEIAAIVDAPESSVRRILRRNNVEGTLSNHIRISKRNKPTICWTINRKRTYNPNREELRSRYESGLTIADIAKEDGVNEVIVFHRIKEYGIETRPPGKRPDGNGDLRSYLRSHSKYADWRSRVIARDGKVCRWCGSMEKLHVDHITPFAELVERATRNVQIDWHKQREACLDYKPLWRANNGRVLCESCHMTTATYGTGSTDNAQGTLF